MENSPQCFQNSSKGGSDVVTLPSTSSLTAVKLADYKLSIFHKDNFRFDLHQIEAIEKIKRQPKFLLSLPTGTGKTTVAFSVVAYLFEVTKLDKVLYVTEHRHLKQTVNDLNKHFSGIHAESVHKKSPKERIKQYERFIKGDLKLIVVNYEILLKDYHILMEVFDHNTTMGIWDEATWLKNENSKYHKIISTFSTKCYRTLALTATPVLSKLKDMQNILRASGIPAVSDLAFNRDFCKWQKIRFGKGAHAKTVHKLKEFKNIDVYNQLVAPYCYSKKKSDIITGRFSYTFVDLSVGSAEREAIKIVDYQMNAWKSDEDKKTLPPLAYISIAMSSPSVITGSSDLSEKESYLFDFINNELEDKMLIYTPYRTVAIYLEGLINQKYGAGYAVSIHGHVKDSDPVKDKFINDSSCRILIGTQSVAKGMDGIQVVCDTVFFHTLPQTAGDFLQIIGRLSRKGGNFNAFNIVLPFVGADQHLDYDLYLVIQNQLRLLMLTTPDSVEDGVVDESIDERLKFSSDDVKWVSNKIELYKKNL